MALLRTEPAGRLRRRLYAPLCVALGLSIWGCALFSGGPPRGGPKFSHRLHVELGGLNCSICHGREMGGALPSMPERDACLVCHKDESGERMIAAYFEDWKLNRPPLGALDPEVHFDHAVHSVTLGDCKSCHAELAASDEVRAEDGLDMQQCVDCHAARGMQEDCATCHEVVDRDWQPANHSQAWIRFHGSVARARTSELEENCGLCHSESNCIQCHQVFEPDNHNNFWRLRGHGMTAAMDRKNCAACHRSDFCVRCHLDTEPLSHRGNWGNPQNDHCLGCHFPVQNEGCFTCHKTASSHALAPPKPSDHFATMNCRQCHGAGLPLPHVDDGTDCNLCHR